jgi:hypothetical protein
MSRIFVVSLFPTNTSSLNSLQVCVTINNGNAGYEGSNWLTMGFTAISYYCRISPLWVLNAMHDGVLFSHMKDVNFRQWSLWQLINKYYRPVNITVPTIRIKATISMYAKQYNHIFTELAISTGLLLVLTIFNLYLLSVYEGHLIRKWSQQKFPICKLKSSRSQQPCGQDVDVWLLKCWDCGFESTWGYGCSSLVSVVCSVGSSLYNKLITHWESYQVCVSLCVILEPQHSGSLGPTLGCCVTGEESKK